MATRFEQLFYAKKARHLLRLRISKNSRHEWPFDTASGIIVYAHMLLLMELMTEILRRGPL